MSRSRRSHHQTRDPQTAEFLKRYRDILDEAFKITLSKSDVGYDSFLPLPLTYPHGSQDLLYILFEKVCRLLGMEKIPKKRDAVFQSARREEARDIITYAAFFVVVHDLENSGGLSRSWRWLSSLGSLPDVGVVEARLLLEFDSALRRNGIGTARVKKILTSIGDARLAKESGSREKHPPVPPRELDPGVVTRV